MPEVPTWRVVRRSLDHPDAARLVEEVQQEYVARYGGRDETPIDPAYFEPPDGAFFVGYLDGEPVATGAWRHTDVAVDGVASVVEVKRMYVAPRAQRRGLARLLLGHLERTAAAAGAGAVVLETGMRQPEAIALYTSSGYEEVPKFGFYRDSPLSRCFGKRLGEFAEPRTNRTGST